MTVSAYLITARETRPIEIPDHNAPLYESGVYLDESYLDISRLIELGIHLAKESSFKSRSDLIRRR